MIQNNNRFPAGWNEDSVRSVLIHYENQTEVEAVEENEAALGVNTHPSVASISDTYLRRISIDPAIMVGKPLIRGTRIPVELLVRMVAQGISYPEILAEYPDLRIADIQAALIYAAAEQR